MPAIATPDAAAVFERLMARDLVNAVIFKEPPPVTARPRIGRLAGGFAPQEAVRTFSNAAYGLARGYCSAREIARSSGRS